jgi:uncharacterized coiled-coil protein SlyX
MDWLFEKREKSLASSAQRIVADMHRHLDREKARNKELESMLIKFQHLCTNSLESEIQRLELRRSEIQQELLNIDKQLLEKRAILDLTKDEIRNILAEKSSATAGASAGSAGVSKLPPHEDNSNVLEEQYMEESELLALCKDVAKGSLFILHRNDNDDIIAYAPLEKANEFVTCYKIVNIQQYPSIQELSMIESMMTYGSKIIPNQDREFPKIHDIHIPTFVYGGIVQDGVKHQQQQKINYQQQQIMQV